MKKNITYMASVSVCPSVSYQNIVTKHAGLVVMNNCCDNEDTSLTPRNKI